MSIFSPRLVELVGRALKMSPGEVDLLGQLAAEPARVGGALNLAVWGLVEISEDEVVSVTDKGRVVLHIVKALRLIDKHLAVELMVTEHRQMSAYIEAFASSVGEGDTAYPYAEQLRDAENLVDELLSQLLALVSGEGQDA